MSTANRMTPSDVSKEAEKKFMEAAEENKDIDFLGVDVTLPGQSWVCLSFLSPEDCIKQRYLYYFDLFLRSLSQKIDLPDDVKEKVGYSTKFEQLVQEGVSYDSVKNAWDDFLHVNSEKIDKKYEEETDGRTSVRGLKVRGSYATWQEAKQRSDRLSELDKSHHVYIGQVGYWLPWDPDPTEVPEQEYQNKKLNELMKRYEENLACRDRFYEERKREKMREALERNKKLKEESKQRSEDESSDARGDASLRGSTEAGASDTRVGDASLRGSNFVGASDDTKQSAQESKQISEENVQKNTNELSKETMKDLENLRNIVQQKDEILLKKKDEERKREDEKLLEEAKEAKNKRKRRTKAASSRAKKGSAETKASRTKEESTETETSERTEKDSLEEQSVSAEIQNVFNSEDPWLSRQKNNDNNDSNNTKKSKNRKRKSRKK